MALLTLTQRKAIFQYLGLGEYNKANIKAFQKKYMLRKEDWDGIYGVNTDNTLRTVYYTKKYTKNFKPEEFRCECGGRYCCGYPSYMKPAELIHIQAIRDKYGKPITITSGLRCKTWNSKCGGSIQNSLHMQGLALDFYQEGVTDTLSNRKSKIKWIAKQPNHHYSYGNGIYRLTTDKTYVGSVNAPYMGNALHTDTNDNVKPTYPKYKETPKVIDISNFQDTINFTKVKADGIKGVIVKCGYRGAEKGALAEDSRFLEHIKGANKAGLAVGIYMFTQAITAEEGKEEAQFAIKMWQKAGVPISFPIAIDTENVFYTENGKKYPGRANGLSKSKRTAVVRAFCKEIKAQGYEPMIYASTSWLNNKLDMSKLPYKVWCAQHASVCEYEGKYILWQYTSEGKVSGVSGNVDMDYCYIDLKQVECPKPKKTIDELAQEVLDGKWGNGDERKEALTKEGYDYDAIQKKVNEILESRKTNGDRIAEAASKYAYAGNSSSAAYVGGKPKAAYEKAIKKAYPDQSGWGKPARDGASCDVYAGVTVRMAGVDPNFPRGLSPSYLAKSNKFDEVKVTAKTIKNGDIIITDKHICIHVDGKIKEASHPSYDKKKKQYVGGCYPKTTNTLAKRLSAKGAKVYRAK